METVQGPLLVIAGAGTGKTRTLTCRLAYQVARAGVAPAHLLAITFTAKAAGEMRERAASLCPQGPDLSGIWIGTMHALGYEILAEHGGLIGLPDRIDIISPADRAGIIRSLAGDCAERDAGRSVRRLEQQLEAERNALCPPDAVSPLCRAYRNELARQGVLDFDDLILKTLELFGRRPRIAQAYRARFTHISVDEYQDINPAQYRLVRYLCPASANICAVGDADQAIYAFRGASIESFLTFQRDFPQAAVVHLERNYRSTGTILQAAGQVIQNNRNRIEKRLVTVCGAGAPVELCRARDEDEEARCVAREVERLVGGTRFETMSHDTGETALGFSDIAILYRLHQQCRPLRRVFEQRGIPVQFAAAQSFYEDPDLKPVIDLLEILADCGNDFAVAEALVAGARSVGRKTAVRLCSQARDGGMSVFSLIQEPGLLSGLPLPARTAVEGLAAFLARLTAAGRSETLDAIIQQIGEHLFARDAAAQDKLLDLRTAAMPFSQGPAAAAAPLFLQRMSFLKEGEQLGPRQEAVNMMTVHGSKGLEFPVVFITGLEAGLFPYRPSSGEPGGSDTEEERRLFYVGMTRAREKLCLTHACSRYLFGERRKMPRSPFLDELPDRLVTRSRQARRSGTSRKGAKQMKLF